MNIFNIFLPVAQAVPDNQIKHYPVKKKRSRYTIEEYTQITKIFPMTNSDIFSPSKEYVGLTEKNIHNLTFPQFAVYLFYIEHFLAKYEAKYANWIENHWIDALVAEMHQPTVVEFLDLLEIPLEGITEALTPDLYKALAYNLRIDRVSFAHRNLTTKIFTARNESFSSLRTLCTPTTVSYTFLWRKDRNIPMPRNLNFLKNRIRIHNWFNLNHRFIVKNLKFTPVHIPIDNLNRHVIVRPQAEALKRRIDRMYFFLSDRFLWKGDNLTTAIKKGFIFFNPDDALEYLDKAMKIPSKNMRPSGQFKTVPINLGLAYKWLHNPTPRFQFRFIPDVHEIGNLMFLYRYHENINFHPSQDVDIKQKRFKGVPIYSIEAFEAIINNKPTSIEYAGKLNPFRKKCKMWFTSLDGLHKAWDYFKAENSSITFPEKPPIIVYNLEAYLKDCEKVLSRECRNFRVVPSERTHYASPKLNPIFWIMKYKVNPLVRSTQTGMKRFGWHLSTGKKHGL
nr:hypothetical protein [Erythrocladia irregularis]